MRTKQESLFESGRLQMTEAIRLTAESLTRYGERYKDWIVAWSGGKDSTATLTVVCWLIESGKVPRPRSLSVLYADTRQELLPLWIAASDIRDDLRERGIACRSVMAPLDRRMWVYILGRGVPPPNNNTLRYCTRQIKIEPMQAAIAEYLAQADGKALVLTGVRMGESAVRDGRISLSCSVNGAECGQGWFQQSLPGERTDTLAPLLHWRVCHVWEWLKHWAPRVEFGDWSTALIADAYGGEEAEEINARTGCVCCPLASKDSALDAIVKMPSWGYLAPLKEIRSVYRWLREPCNRLRKPGGERRKDGTLCTNQQRLGPIKLSVRSEALARVLRIQDRVNTAAIHLKRPMVNHLDDEEIDRIEHLIAAETWPDGWGGTEPSGEVVLPDYHADGSIQHLLFGEHS